MHVCMNLRCVWVLDSEVLEKKECADGYDNFIQQYVVKIDMARIFKVITDLAACSKISMVPIQCCGFNFHFYFPVFLIIQFCLGSRSFASMWRPDTPCDNWNMEWFHKWITGGFIPRVEKVLFPFLTILSFLIWIVTRGSLRDIF